jgi:NCS1 family nucleobase:cation symporter-1
MDASAHTEQLSGADRAGRVEIKGIDYIPDSERHGSPRELFGVWTAAMLAPLYLILGGLLVTLGFNLWQAFLALVLGYAFYAFLGVQAVAGPRAGTPTITISRAQYGLRGNLLSAALAWFNLVAFIAINFSIASLAMFSLADLAGVAVTDAVKALLLVVVIAITFAVAYFGHATLVAFQTWAAYALGAGALLLLVFILGDVDWSYRPETPLTGWAGFALWLLGLNVMMSGALSWCSMPADYSRYLPRNASPQAVAFYTAAGGAIPALGLGAIGILAGTAVDMSDPTTALEPILPGWFYPLFLIVVVLGTVANNVVTVYSSSLSLQALGVDVRRPVAVVVNTAIGAGMAVYAIFVSDFLATLTEFLQLMLFWYAPFAAIFIVDLMLRRTYNGVELHRRGGRYWYEGGVFVPGVVALLAGMAAAAMFGNTEHFQGPISSALDDTDLSALVGILVGGGLYWALARRRIARGEQADPATRAVAPTSPESDALVVSQARR